KLLFIRLTSSELSRLIFHDFCIIKVISYFKDFVKRSPSRAVSFFKMKSLFPIFYHRAGRSEKIRLMLLVLFLNGLFWGCSSGSEQGSAGLEVREFTLESALNSGREDKKEIGEHLKIKQSVILE